MLNLFLLTLWEAKLPILALASVLLCLVVFASADLRERMFIRPPVYVATALSVVAFFVYWEHPEDLSRNHWLSLASMVLCIASVIRMAHKPEDDDVIEQTHEPVHVSPGKSHHSIPIVAVAA